MIKYKSVLEMVQPHFGGSGSTSTMGAIAPELRGLYGSSADALVNQQKDNPLGQYNQSNPLEVAGVDPLQKQAIDMMQKGNQPSGLDALTMQSILRMPGLAGAGPTTGQYNYGSEAGLGDFMQYLNPNFDPNQIQNVAPKAPGATDSQYGGLKNTLATPPPPPVGVGGGGAPGQVGSGAGAPSMSSMGSRSVMGGNAAKLAASNPMYAAGASRAALGPMPDPSNTQATREYNARLDALAGQGHQIEGSPGSTAVNFASAGHGAPAMIVGPNGEISYPGGTDQGFLKGSMTPGASQPAPAAPAPAAAAPAPARGRAMSTVKRKA